MIKIAILEKSLQKLNLIKNNLKIIINMEKESRVEYSMNLGFALFLLGTELFIYKLVSKLKEKEDEKS